MSELSYRENMKRDSEGIWIPKEVWTHPSINIQAKALWAQIFALHDDEIGGCCASNEKLAEKFQCEANTVAKIISGLRRVRMIEDVSFDGRMRVIRAILPKKQGEQ